MIWRNWNPLAEMETLRREIDRAFEGVGAPSRSGRSLFLPGRAARAYPLMNVTDDEESVYVEALAPGIDPETIGVSITGNTLTLTGEKKASPGVKPEQVHRSERATGKFVRSLDLGVAIDVADVKAEYADGILLVTLPKAAEAKPRQISVNVK